MPVTQRRQSGPSPMYREESWGAELSTAAENPNRNVNWMGRKEFWAFYVLCILGLRFLLSWFLADPSSWTATSLLHGLFSFWALHWAKGSVIGDDQGEYNDKTLWEQLDQGMPWTATKKFLILVPVALYLYVCHVTDYSGTNLITNTVIVFILVVAKLPEMHKVRIFGINSTPGIDQ